MYTIADIPESTMKPVMGGFQTELEQNSRQRLNTNSFLKNPDFKIGIFLF
jgi:hypothetical protein